MFRAFSLRNVLWGIFLGLLFVGVWMYYPELIDRFRSSVPKVKEKVAAFIRNYEERFKPYAKKVSISLAEKREALVSSLSGDDESEPAGVHETASLEDVSREPEAEKGIKPYHAGEESQWQELKVSEGPEGTSEKKVMYPFLTFDRRENAENLMASIKRSTGIDLRVGQRDHKYMVFIPAADEEEKNHKAALILEEAGIGGK